MSEGEYISLGHFEKDDLSCVIEYLRETERASYIGLWGRSMGGNSIDLGITSLLHADRDPSIAGMVIDSALTDLTTLASDLYKSNVKLPNFLLKPALGMIRDTVMVLI